MHKGWFDTKVNDRNIPLKLGKHTQKDRQEASKLAVSQP